MVVWNSEAIQTKGFLAGPVSVDVGVFDLLESGNFLENNDSYNF